MSKFHYLHDSSSYLNTEIINRGIFIDKGIVHIGCQNNDPRRAACHGWSSQGTVQLNAGSNISDIYICCGEIGSIERTRLTSDLTCCMYSGETNIKENGLLLRDRDRGRELSAKRREFSTHNDDDHLPAKLKQPRKTQISTWRRICRDHGGDLVIFVPRLCSVKTQYDLRVEKGEESVSERERESWKGENDTQGKQRPEGLSKKIACNYTIDDLVMIRKPCPSVPSNHLPSFLNRVG